MNDLLPCPFCGEQPEVFRDGTWISIECCVSMSIQKSDELTMDERYTWDPNTHLYSPAAEYKAFNIIKDEWNTRK